jgi:long-subunit acyl-CoA synthetase (AMP-forming)
MSENTDNVLRSDIALGEVTRNIGTVILANAKKFPQAQAMAERRDGQYRYWTWGELADDVMRVAAYYQSKKLSSGAKIGFVAVNSYWRMVTELACMASGYISVPVFTGYPVETLTELLKFTEVELLVTDSGRLIEKLPKSELKNILMIGSRDLQFAHLNSEQKQILEQVFADVHPQSVSMIMFTSGTSGLPKGVQLTHFNILSQQKSLQLLWKAETGMRFLCYLPWHHSFGGLFERFFVICSGGCLAIDDSFGKNIDQLMKNYAEIKPHVYFSVPKIYQELITRVLSSKEVENTFFHPDLKFIFTAAAPLPLSISDVFKAKKIPVAEGWGLTETSPCCTLTKLSLERKPGVVGLPLPGIEIKLDESGEILVRGPNVMTGYYKMPDATKDVLENNGWFHTGDLGEVTSEGIRILSRKDRMFKLSNGEKVFPAEIEERIKARCKFIKYAYVFGKAQNRISMLVFPNFELFGVKKDSCFDESGCQYPCSNSTLNDCLGTCVAEINSSVQAGFERVGKVVIVPHELSIDKRELTPSFKLVPRVIEDHYRNYMTETLPPDAHTFQVGHIGQTGQA